MTRRRPTLAATDTHTCLKCGKAIAARAGAGIPAPAPRPRPAPKRRKRRTEPVPAGPTQTALL